MSVSDNGQDQAPDIKPIPKTKPNWPLIQEQYETGAMGQRKLAKVFRVSYSTLAKRAMRERWKRRATMVNTGANLIKEALHDEMESAITSIAKHEAERFHKELQPWIERRKIEIVKRGHSMYDEGTKRIKRLWKANAPVDAKKESEAARAIETLVRVGRTSLGMGDNSTIGSTFSMNILANQAAIQVNPGSKQ